MNREIEQFHDAIEAAGFTPPSSIVADGVLHRFSSSGRPKDEAGWYVLWDGAIPAGAFGCWRAGRQHTWIAKEPDEQEKMTQAEREAFARQMRDAARQREVLERERRARAAAASQARWQAAVPVITHPYLERKGVRGYGIRVEACHTLLVPLRDSQGRLHSLQAISPDGSKRFMPGGRVNGCYHSIGQPSGTLVISEGYATAATLHEDTGRAVAVAFHAGNLKPVAQALRAKFPCLSIVIAADDDWRTEGNPGLTAAREAAQAIGGSLAVPDFTGFPRGDKDTDFNDLHRLATFAGVAQ